MLAQISSFMKRPNILRLIVILFNKKLYLEISRPFVNLNDQPAEILSKSLREPRIDYIVTSFVHTIYMHQLEGEC